MERLGQGKKNMNPMDGTFSHVPCMHAIFAGFRFREKIRAECVRRGDYVVVRWILYTRIDGQCNTCKHLDKMER